MERSVRSDLFNEMGALLAWEGTWMGGRSRLPPMFRGKSRCPPFSDIQRVKSKQTGNKHTHGA